MLRMRSFKKCILSGGHPLQGGLS